MPKIQDFTHPEKPISILLGAGASIDAGIPGTRQLTKQLYEKLSETQTNLNFRKMFGYIIAGIQQNNALNNLDVFEYPNIEEVISALELISSRHRLEASPFIGNWDTKIESFEFSENIDTSAFGDSFKAAFEKSLEIFQSASYEIIKALSGMNDMRSGTIDFAESNVRYIFDAARRDLEETAREIESSIQQVLKKKDTPIDNWGNLYSKAHSLLSAIMWITEPDSCTYLEPLLKLNASKTNLFTLNYDTAIEIVAEAKGIKVSDGFGDDAIDPLYTGLYNPDSKIHILKLHGSINWVLDPDLKIARKKIQKRTQFHFPLLVFGKREKLRSSGPFLDLLFEFKSRLQEVETMAVIGYSFQDEHVNKYLIEWIKSTNNRLIIASGPEFKLPKSISGFSNIINTGLGIQEFIS